MDVLELVSGVTDKDALVADRFGVDMSPEEIGWVFDIGCGDGLWSRVMEDYAPTAKIYEYDWRVAALGRPSVRSVYPSSVERMMVPKAILSSVPRPTSASQLLVDMMECETKSIASMLSSVGADPLRTVMRVSCVCMRDIIQQLEDAPTLLMFILQTPSSDTERDGAFVSAMLGTRYNVIQEKEKGILYVKAKPVGEAEGTDRREAGSDELMDSGPPDDGLEGGYTIGCDWGVPEEPADSGVSDDNPGKP